MKQKLILVAFFLTSLLTTVKAEDNVADHLQSISVTIASGGSSGSGVIITREVLHKDHKEKVNFVLTAAHVIDNLRSVRTVIENGKEKKIVEFKSPQITKILVENGRTIGRLVLDTKVVKYSDSENGVDIAVLMILKRDFIQDTTKFATGTEVVPIGTKLLHVGSLLGQNGANSMTNGIMSQVGRVLDLGNDIGKVFDQTTVTAFPGSSGGGVFKEDGTYIGMLVRGAGETFNLITPSRRINGFLEESKMQWLVDPTKEVPSLEEISKISIEGQGNIPEVSSRASADETHTTRELNKDKQAK
jgi:S1-C subfamily serine protease